MPEEGSPFKTAPDDELIMLIFTASQELALRKELIKQEIK